MKNFRDMINAVARAVVNETERQFTNEQVPGWYLVDGDSGDIADGPYDSKEQAQERAGYPTELAQYWNGHKWSTVDSHPEEYYQMLPDGTKVIIKTGNLHQGQTGEIRGQDESDQDANTEWARYNIVFPDGGRVFKKKHQFDVVANESDEHEHTGDDCEVCDSNLMELPEDIEDGIIEGVDEIDGMDELEEGMFDTKTSKYFPEATNLDDGHMVDMAWEWIQVDLRDNPQADESDIYRFVLSTQEEKGLSDKDAQFIRLQAEEFVSGRNPMDEDTNHMGEHEFQSFKSWIAACKKRNPGVWFDGDSDIANAMIGPKPYIQGETISMGEWDGEVGVIYAPMQEATVDRNPNIKQNQPADLMQDILAKDDNGDEMDSTEIDRLKQLAGLK